MCDLNLYVLSCGYCIIILKTFDCGCVRLSTFTCACVVCVVLDGVCVCVTNGACIYMCVGVSVVCVPVYVHCTAYVPMT